MLAAGPGQASNQKTARKVGHNAVPDTRAVLADERIGQEMLFFFYVCMCFNLIIILNLYIFLLLLCYLFYFFLFVHVLFNRGTQKNAQSETVAGSQDHCRGRSRVLWVRERAVAV